MRATKRKYQLFRVEATYDGTDEENKDYLFSIFVAPYYGKAKVTKNPRDAIEAVLLYMFSSDLSRKEMSLLIRAKCPASSAQYKTKELAEMTAKFIARDIYSTIETFKSHILEQQRQMGAKLAE